MNDFLQKLNIPCVVFDNNNNIVSTNSCFVQEFGNIDNLNRFKNKSELVRKVDFMIIRLPSFIGNECERIARKEHKPYTN